MNKSFKIALIILLVFAFAFGVFSSAMGGSQFMAAGQICPKAGWNSRLSNCTFSILDTPQVLSYKQEPYRVTPFAGWNT